MSKYRYKCVEFKHVDWSELSNRIEGERVVLAVDVAKEAFVATILTPGPVRLLTFSWSHPWETGPLLEQLAWLGQGRRLEAVMEPSGTYGDALAWQLRQGGIALYRISPKRVHDAAEVYDGVPSMHDAKAAELIGRLHLEGVSQPWLEPSEDRRVAAVQLTQLRVSKAHQQSTSNRLEAQLSRHWPESIGILGLDTATLPVLIQAYGDPASVAADPEGAAELMRRTGGPGLREEKIQAFVAGAQHSLGVPCLEAERALLQWFAADLIEARRQVRQIEQAIERQVESEPVLKRLAEVIGKISAAVLLATVGSPQNYPDANSYLKALGLNLKERSSGRHKGQLRITKRGPSLARFYLYFAALRLIARNPVVKRWYAWKSGRPGAIKSKLVIALMRKLAKALWHIARGGQFDADKLFDLEAVTGV